MHCGRPLAGYAVGSDVPRHSALLLCYALPVMDANLNQIKSLCDIVDAQRTHDAETIVAQAAQIQDLRAQLDALKNPPAGIAFSNLEKLTSWIQPGTTGNSGGGDPNAPKQGVMTPGSPAQFKTTATLPYHNPYWYIQLAKLVPNVMGTTKFRYSLQWQFASQAALDACQAVEFELQQHIGTEIYNMAWQMELKQYKQWKTFDYTAKKWESAPTAIPVDFSLIAPGKFLSVVADYVRDPVAKTLKHVSLTVNGRTMPVNVSRPASIGGSAQSFNAAFQLDTSSKPTNYSVLVQNMGVLAS